MLQSLGRAHCGLEPAADKIVGVDVLPDADIHEVYAILEQAERAGIIEFEGGHCGHPLESKPQ